LKEFVQNHEKENKNELKLKIQIAARVLANSYGKYIKKYKILNLILDHKEGEYWENWGDMNEYFLQNIN